MYVRVYGENEENSIQLSWNYFLFGILSTIEENYSER